jgi:multidrug resistance efflux pump
VSGLVILAAVFIPDYVSADWFRSSITIRAPIDGYVLSLAPEQTILDRGLSPAQKEFDALRSRIAASYRRSDSTPSYATLLKESTAGALLAEIRADSIDLQLALEAEKLKLARAKLDQAVRTLAFEQNIRPVEDSREQARSAFMDYSNRVPAEQLMNVFGKSTNYKEALTTHVDTLRQKQLEAFTKRAGENLTILQERVRIAGQELAVAELTAAIVTATAKLGQLVCPMRCRVRKLNVVPGQYVTKGDPVAEVVFLD